MTDENKPLRSLFDAPGEDPDGDATYHRVTPLQVVDEADRLDEPIGALLVEIFRRGAATAGELADGMELSRDRIERHLTELKLQGYLTTTRQEGVTKFTVSDSWATEDFPSGPVIPLVYQYNLLSDRSRLEAVETAIEDVVEEGDVVADLGAGVGLLSYLASRVADHVYAVEIDTEVYEKGKEVMRANDVDNVEYIMADARNVTLPEEVDVVLCEMLDTALVAELQVPVMNHAVDTLLAPDGTTVPSEAKTTVSLVNSPYQFCGGEFELPHFEAYGSDDSATLSEEVTYHTVEFDGQNDTTVRERVTVTASDSGCVNGIQLNTYVRFAEGMPYTSPSQWLNPPLTLPTQQSYEVEEGEEFTVALSYGLGDGLNDISYSVERRD